MGIAHTSPVRQEHSPRRTHGNTLLGDSIAHRVSPTIRPTTGHAEHSHGAMEGMSRKLMSLRMGAGRTLAGQLTHPILLPIHRTVVATAFGLRCDQTEILRHVAPPGRARLETGSCPRCLPCPQCASQWVGHDCGYPHHSRPSLGRQGNCLWADAPHESHGMAPPLYFLAVQHPVAMELAQRQDS